MTALRAIVVGCGDVGSRYDAAGGPPLSHAGAYAAHPDVALVAGVDPDPGARADFESARGVPAFATLDEALAAGAAESPDLASIAAPPAGRLALVRRLTGAGVRAIWCEKPLGEEGQAVVEHCEATGTGLQMNFLRRFDPFHRELVDGLRAQGVVLADFRYSGTLANYGSHALDLFRWLAGEPVSVFARGLADGGAYVVAETAAGTVGSFMHVTSEADLDVFEWDVRTRSGRTSSAALGTLALAWPPAPSALFAGVRSPEPGAVAGGGLAQAMLAGAGQLVAHVRDGAPLACTGRDGLAEERLRAAVQASLRTGAAVAVAPA